MASKLINKNTTTAAFADCWQSQTLTFLFKWLGIFIVLLCVVSIISNLVICMVYRKQFFRSNQHLLMVCLAIADLFNAVVIMPLEATSHLTYQWEEYYLQPDGVLFENAIFFMGQTLSVLCLSLIHISEPTRLLSISYAVFCLKKVNLHNVHSSMQA